MRLLFLVLGSMGLVPYQGHDFKQASQTRKRTKIPSSWLSPGPSIEGSPVTPSHPQQWGPRGHFVPAQAPEKHFLRTGAAAQCC